MEKENVTKFELLDDAVEHIRIRWSSAVPFQH